MDKFLKVLGVVVLAIVGLKIFKNYQEQQEEKRESDVVINNPQVTEDSGLKERLIDLGSDFIKNKWNAGG